MNKIFRKINLLIGLLVFASQSLFAQAKPNEENFIDGFYASGKIMVVIAGLGIVLAILILYLFRLEKKLNKIEKQK